MTYVAGAQATDADAGFTLARGVLDEVIAKLTTFPDAVGAGKIKVSGNPLRLGELMMLMDEFPRMFEIVEPKRTPVSYLRRDPEKPVFGKDHVPKKR